jgi:hypothetical protein
MKRIKLESLSYYQQATIQCFEEIYRCLNALFLMTA